MKELRFPADESCDFSVVRALRDSGYDVTAVGEYTKRSVDNELLSQAHREHRILLTEDKDFGWLVFAGDSESAGVILIRFPAGRRSSMGQSILQLVRVHGAELENAFVVIQPGQIRFSRKE